MPLISETSVTELARALGQPGTAPPAAATRPPIAPALLEQAIAHRRAVHRFGSRPLTDTEVATVVRAARAAPPVRTRSPLEIAVALSGNQAPRAGVFWTNEDGGLAGPLAGESLVGELHKCYVAAPVLLLICGPISASAEEYRTVLLAAGSCGYTAWLAAVSSGLAGCVYGRSHGQLTGMLAGAGRHLFTLAIGHPA
jgi:nitroreductase